MTCEELDAMKSSLLVLFEFKICLTYDFTWNLHSFAVVLHNYPLKVEQTQLYSLVKKWISPEDVQEALALHSMIHSLGFIPFKRLTPKWFDSSSNLITGTSQGRGKLLCWGKTKKRVGLFSFKLPEVVSSRLSLSWLLECACLMEAKS